MSILRFDVTTRDWLIYAPERAHRPRDTAPNRPISPAPEPHRCPFCPGNEDLTPIELHADRQAGASSWRVRVIPNKFPALRVDDGSGRVEDGSFFQQMGGYGAHEVVVESPDHRLFLGHQPDAQVETLLRCLRDRSARLLEDPRIQAVVVFKNHGERAGTSLRHPHWQIIATPVTPRTLRLKHAIATEHFDRTGRCLHCALLEAERAAGVRILTENEAFSAILPYASQAPYQIRILPRQHASAFARTHDGALKPLALILKAALSVLHRALGDPDFNLVINTAPRDDEDKGYFLWHIDVLPRLSMPAGFEMGSGMAINAVLPEEAARQLREVRVRE